MNMPDRLAKSILSTLGLYLLLQCGIYLAFAIPARPALEFATGRGFVLKYGPEFLVTTIAFHLFLLVLLLLFKQDFVKESTGEKLERVNLANRITLLRVSTLPTLLFLVMAAREYRIRLPLLLLVVFIFATDFVDGYVSRKAGEVTRVGRMMDAASDYSLLIVLTVVFYYFSLIPLWFFVLVVARLGIQAILMTVLVVVKKKIEPKTTLMGKAAVASIMVLYAAELMRLVFNFREPLILALLEWAVGALVLASVVDKLIAFVRDLSRGNEGRTKAETKQE